MTIADKLITIADNTSAVADVVNFSRDFIVAESTTGKGAALVIRDVLTEKHKISVTTVPGADVKVVGKNLIETASVDAEADKNKVLFQGSVTGDFVFSCLFNYTECRTPNAAQFEFVVDGAKVYQARGSSDVASNKLSGTLTKITFLNWGYGVGTVDNIQLEAGTTATDYEVYKEQTGIAKSDGYVEGLMSESPMMVSTTGEKLSVSYFPQSSAEIYDKYQQIKTEERYLSNLIKEG